tara:strand:+ start:1629 stop:1802 length:174 start_codon:yes stop_codon:yes gene_type:complete
MDKVGVGGVIIAALSCAGCFPALGALAATLGLGFLSQLEGVAITAYSDERDRSFRAS